MPNPIWVSLAMTTVSKLSKKCTHCGKTGTYAAKRPGQFYTCKYCGHRFKEREKK
jgi:DNA-directed RNA polymerase subunit RPC12/RpoP